MGGKGELSYIKINKKAGVGGFVGTRGNGEDERLRIGSETRNALVKWYSRLPKEKCVKRNRVENISSGKKNIHNWERAKFAQSESQPNRGEAGKRRRKALELKEKM